MLPIDDYVKKTSNARASLVINEEQAAVVRSIFEMFASCDYGLVTITRFLEDRRIPTRTGRPQWDRGQIKFMLKNETYAGTRYYNRITAATEAARQGKQVIRGKWVLRDRTEWIAVEVPAIVPRELFEKVQQRLRQHEERYCLPVTRYLLSGLVQCAVCGSGCSSSRRYHKVRRPSGGVSVYHRSVYRCNRRARQYAHDLTPRCRNSEIGTHILEGKVFEMIRETMLDPGKLRGCLDGGGTDDRSTARDFARIARMISALDEDRRQMIDRYAADQVTGDEYITANRALDQKLERLVREKAKLAAALRSAQYEDFVDASVRQFCATAKARLQACSDFDANRQFLVDHVERVIFDHYKVTVVGSVPVQTASETIKLPFRIDGTIDIAAIRSKSSRRAAKDAMRSIAAVSDAPVDIGQFTLRAVSAECSRHAQVLDRHLGRNCEARIKIRCSAGTLIHDAAATSPVGASRP